MKWFSTKEKLPNDQEEILVRNNGLVSLAKFDHTSRKFNLRDGTVIRLNGENIEWTELVAPGRAR